MDLPQVVVVLLELGRRVVEEPLVGEDENVEVGLVGDEEGRLREDEGDNREGEAHCGREDMGRR